MPNVVIPDSCSINVLFKYLVTNIYQVLLVENITLKKEVLHNAFSFRTRRILTQHRCNVRKASNVRVYTKQNIYLFYKVINTLFPQSDVTHF